jgi:beta-fructofuranosidase
MEIRILMDKYTVELFADGGRYAMSSLIYTDLSCEGICFSADGESCFTVEKYDMEIS